VSSWTLLGLGLLAIGLLAGSAGLAMLGGLTLLSRWATTLWSRYGLVGVRYSRTVGARHAVWGDEVPLEVAIWNAKPLPLPWIAADDSVSEGLRVRGVKLESSDRPGRENLRSTWTLLWYERVTRRLRIVADRRGRFEFGPVRLTVADLFERGTRDDEHPLPAELLVRPRSIPVRARHPLAAPLGNRRTAASLYEDPALFAGVRPWQPADPLRRIHWRASARLGRPVSRRYEPVSERQLLIVLDVQTVEGPHWLLVYDDDLVESMCVTAASLARAALASGAACGLLVGNQPLGAARASYVAPDASPGQLGRIEDELARLSPISAVPFDRLLATIPRRVRPGSTLVTLSGRSTLPYLATMRRLQRSGYELEHVSAGPDANRWRGEAQTAGMRASTAHLEPGWRDADAVVLAR
jgi:uncharacterized protein (DUF58 family)